MSKTKEEPKQQQKRKLKFLSPVGTSKVFLKDL